MTAIIIDPKRKYEINGQVYPVLSKYSNYTVSNNQLVVAGVSGYRVLVMGWIIQSLDAAGSAVGFKSASGGTSLAYIAAPALIDGPEKQEITDTGWFETNTGEGLYLDVSTFTANITIFYIQYKV